MKLTGRCKEQFEEWIVIRHAKHIHIDDFYSSLDSMKWGVYVDFFDSVGIYITLIPNWKKGIRTFRVGLHIEHGGIVDSVLLRPEKSSPTLNEYANRHKARTAAIEKANEIVNNR